MTTLMPAAARVLITGGSGFIGTNLAAKYLGANIQVLALDALPPRNPALASVSKQVDLLDADGLADAVQAFAPTHVFHLGARTDLDGETPQDYAANTQGTQNLIDAIALQPSIQRVVFASSMLVCKMGYRPRDEFDYCPSTPYGESKVEMEKLIRAAELTVPWVTVRPTSIWGPWFGVPYNDFFRAVVAGRFVHPGSGAVHQSFGFVGNTTHELDVLATTDQASVEGKTFYLADYPPLEFGAWADAIAAGAGAKPIRTVPLALLRAAAKVGDGLQKVTGKTMPLTSFRLGNLITENVQDLDPLSEVVGALPYSNEQAIELTLDWLKDHDGLKLSS